MRNKELFNKAIVAASVAEASGYHATSAALLEIAAGLYTEMDHADRDEGKIQLLRNNNRDVVATT